MFQFLKGDPSFNCITSIIKFLNQHLMKYPVFHRHQTNTIPPLHFSNPITLSGQKNLTGESIRFHEKAKCV